MALIDVLAVYDDAQSCLNHTEERAIPRLRRFTRVGRTSVRVL